MRKRKGFGWIAILFVSTAGITTGIAMLRTNIIERKQEAKMYPMMLTKLTDENVDPAEWGKSFPSQYESFMKTQEDSAYTAFGGSLPYSKLIRYPQLTRLWGGYAFAADFNEERGHYYSQIDQLETKRNDKEYLNAHGFPKFKGQPGTCINCHSGWTPKLIRDLGWLEFNKTPYQETADVMIEKFGKKHAKLGSTCADCHHPDDMSLRVTRPAYINAMEDRGYEKDEKSGIKGTRREMRSHVCQQCHVEYYFKEDTKELTFPWSAWPKDEEFVIEALDTYYDNVRKDPEAFQHDWIHNETGAPMLKVQHPETELFAGGIHARSGVSCADCHMPFKKEGAIKNSDHHIRSPLLDVKASCGTCHNLPESELRERVASIQNKTATSLREAEAAVLALIDDIVAAKEVITELDEEAINAILKEPREMHRKASMRWDFVASENSTGFHNPEEALRILGQAQDMARRGQLHLIKNLAAHDKSITPTTGSGAIPEPGEVIEEHHPPVGSVPPAGLLAIDKELAK